MTSRMRKDSTTQDYRIAISGEGEFGSLGYDWADKPHRLVYDLCGEVDALKKTIIEHELLSGLLYRALSYYDDPELYFDIFKTSEKQDLSPNYDISEVKGEQKPGRIAREALDERDEKYPDLTLRFHDE